MKFAGAATISKSTLQISADFCIIVISSTQFGNEEWHTSRDAATEKRSFTERVRITKKCLTEHAREALNHNRVAKKLTLKVLWRIVLKSCCCIRACLHEVGSIGVVAEGHHHRHKWPCIRGVG